MNGRALGAIEIVIFGLAVTALFAVVALIAKVIFKKSIGTSKYYSTGLTIGCLIYVGLISVSPKTGKTEAGSTVPLPLAGLDAPFIAPSKDKVESFIPQLTSATMKLAPDDKAQLNDAVRFLSYASTDYIKQNEPDTFAKWNELDALAHSLNKLYNYAVEQGNTMTLRKYILLADEFKKQRPELYQQFKSSSK